MRNPITLIENVLAYPVLRACAHASPCHMPFTTPSAAFLIGGLLVRPVLWAAFIGAAVSGMSAFF